MDSRTLMQSTRLLLGLCGGLFLAAVLYWLVRPAGAGSLSRTVIAVVAALMLVDALGMLVLAWALPRLPAWALWVAVGFVVVNVVLTFADDVGVADLAAFVLEASALALLILVAKRKRAGTA